MPIKFNPATGRYENYTRDGGFSPIGPMGQPRPTPATSPTTTVPMASTTTVPAATTGAPRGSKRASGGTAQRGGMGGPTAAQVKAGQYVGGKGFVTENVGLSTSAVEKALKEGTISPEVLKLIQEIYGAGGGAGADKTTDYKNAYRSGIAGARQQELAAQQAREMYDKAAESLYGSRMEAIGTRYAPQMTALEDYYRGQSTAATEAINKAAQDALANIKDPTAFANLQALVGAAPQQGLGADLTAYGASGAAAQQQAASDEAYNKFIADLQNRSYQTTQAAGQDYTTALRNAITGSQAGALQGLAQTVAGLRSQDVAGLRGRRAEEEAAVQAVRDSLTQAGLQAMLEGKQTAAATRVATEQKYGAYKPKKSSKKKQSA